MRVRQGMVAGLVLLGLVATALPAAAAAAPERVVPAAVQATVMTTVTPFTPAGRLKGSMSKNASIYDVSSCVDSDVSAEANVYGCGSVADYLPACWPTPAHKKMRVMVCMRHPADKTFVEVPFTVGDVPEVPQSDRAWPWQITLIGGGVCLLRMSSAWSPAPDGYQRAYDCSGSPVAAGLLFSSEGALLEGTNPIYLANAITSGGAVTTVEVEEIVTAAAAPTMKKAKATKKCPANAALRTAVPAKKRLVPHQKTICVGKKWAYRSMVLKKPDAGGNYWVTQGLFHKKGRSWSLVTKPCKKSPGPPAGMLFMCMMG